MVEAGLPLARAADRRCRRRAHLDNRPVARRAGHRASGQRERRRDCSAVCRDAVFPGSCGGRRRAAHVGRHANAATRAADIGGGEGGRVVRSADLSRRSAAESAKARRRKARSRRDEGAKAEGAKAENDKKSPAADASVLAEASARTDRSRTAAENAAAAPAAPAQPMAKTFSFGAPETVIVSSNPASRWRILQGGQVQRSADGGATWQTQTTGVSDTLSGGSSPSPSVCWLVGPRGIVLRTTDGRSWTRIPFPEAVPLTSIRATDDQTATVTTADGRQFVTEDGGRTWARKEF